MRTRTGPLSGRRILRLPQIVGSLAAVFGVFTLIFGAWTATSIWSFPRFVIVVLILIYLPGKLLLDTARLRLKTLEDLTLSLVLGTTVSGLLYWMAVYVGWLPLFALWPLLAVMAYLYRRRKSWRDVLRFRVSVGLTHTLLLSVIIAGLAPLVMLPMYYHNLAVLPSGGMTFLTKPKDVIFHLSIGQELTHSIPPQAPFLAGQPLGYHHAMDLLVAMLSKSAGLSVLDLTVRFLPTFFVVVMVLAIFCFGRVWLGSGPGAVLTAFLVIFGEDLSFIPGLLLGSRDAWSAQFFGVPTTYSLYFMNPMLPALGVLFCGLFCLVRFCREGGKAWLILTAFLFAIAMEYKVFVTAQVLAGLAVAGVICLVLFRDSRLLKILLLTALFATPLVLYTVLGTEAAARVWVRIDPWPYIPKALEQFNLSNTSFGYYVSALFGRGPGTFAGAAMLLLVGLPMYLVGSLGLRVVAIPRMLRDLVSPVPAAVERFFVVVFLVLGPLIALTSRVTPREYPGDYNNAVWFYVQSKYVIWIFVVELILSLLRGRKLAWHAVILTVLVGLTIPSSIQYLHVQTSHRLDILDESELELVDFLGRGCPQGEVAFGRQDVVQVVVAMTKCRVPIVNLGIYPHSFATMADLDQRRTDSEEFWDNWNEGRLRADILERYGVDYVVADKRAGDLVPVGPFGSEGDHQPAGTGVAVLPTFENDYFVVYRVLTDDEQPT